MAAVLQTPPKSGPGTVTSFAGYDEQAGDCVRWASVASRLKSACADFKELSSGENASPDLVAVQSLRAVVDEFDAALAACNPPTSNSASRLALDEDEDHSEMFLGDRASNEQVLEIVPAQGQVPIFPFAIVLGREPSIIRLRYRGKQLDEMELLQACQFLEMRRASPKAHVPLTFTTVVRSSFDQTNHVGCALPIMLKLDFYMYPSSSSTGPPCADGQSSPWLPPRSTVSTAQLESLNNKTPAIFRYELKASFADDGAAREPLAPVPTTTYMHDATIKLDVQFLQWRISNCTEKDFVGLCEHAAALLVRDRLFKSGRVRDGCWDVVEGFTVMVSKEGSRIGSYAHCLAVCVTVDCASLESIQADSGPSPLGVSTAPSVTSDAPSVVPDAPSVAPDAPLVAADAPDALSVAPDAAAAASEVYVVPTDVPGVPATQSDADDHPEPDAAPVCMINGLPDNGAVAPTPANTPTIQAADAVNAPAADVNAAAADVNAPVANVHAPVANVHAPVANVTVDNVVHLPPVTDNQFQQSEDPEWYLEQYELL
ncbi:hypothetical protein EIP86_007010 [Pleurotus ostreatoroseus]|nr:hypothetical protein EIP86_007010 [Pleurotus ostreatoroseus]